ncbi:hypothetical protein LTR62_006884 [Meristemomyces frigidus]|uniref:Spindle pole body component n=1 Tax=Meristemomyces frigidus TaxID=1508187 RepID=A0AAN7TBQ9_9PEZI|nr:hypothetical protein LTR62_006884 [Meristemomyces frigidus]
MDDGHAFVVDKLQWNRELDLAPDHNSIFQIPSTTPGDLDLYDEIHRSILDLHLEDLCFAEAEDLTLDELSGLQRGDDPGSDDRNQEPVSDLNIWSLDLTNAAIFEPVGRLRTWEAFSESQASHTMKAAYLSEAGPDAFDAALSMQPGAPHGVVPSGIFLCSLLNLALGRSSIFFQWDDIKQVFFCTLDSTIAAGLSELASHSVIFEVMEYAVLLRKLQALASCSPAQRICAVAVALRRACATVLEAVETYITALDRIVSVLQLQEALQRPSQILQLVDRLINTLEPVSADDDAIVRLADAVSLENSSGSCLRDLNSRLLERSSRPWLTTLAGDVGLIQPIVSVASALPSFRQTSGSLDIDVSATTHKSKTTRLLSSADSELVSSAKETVKMLRMHFPDTSCEPNHQLSWYGQALVINNDVELHIGDPMADVIHASSPADLQNDDIYKTDIQMFTEPADLSGPAPDNLYASAWDALSGMEHDSTESRILKDFNPFDQIRSSVAEHAQTLNRALLSRLFNDRNLRLHLELQHGFQLLGNGEFVARLTTALFSPETQSAERRRGMIPTAQTMGLRLGVRGGQRWPPASSELRLTLLGVLTEAYDGGKSNDLPGGMSFAIRGLSDADIDKVMDASSLYALDFLKLQYTAPRPLDELITPANLQVYDDVFRSMLRVLRVHYITVHMRSTARNPPARHRASTRFAQAAHHAVAALMSYFMDIGIAAPWTTLQLALDSAQASVIDRHHNGQVAGISDLRRIHNKCLESIRARLFLTRKQSAIRAAVDDVLEAVLGVAARQHNDTLATSALYSDFDSSVRALVDLLRRAVDRPARRDDEVEYISLLLQRLDFNKFYENGMTDVVE